MAYTTIDNPELYFQVQLYTGTGSSNAITLDGDEDMQPDLVYLKRRDDGGPPMFFDAVRGAGERLQTNNDDAEATHAQQLTAFGSDGFTVGTHEDANNSSATYVAWCWKESATSGFDIVSFTGNATARTISHSLSAVPRFMIVKNRADTSNMLVYHGANTSAPATDGLTLNENEATDDDAGYWNDTDPTSSVFSVGTNNNTNGDSDAMIAYLFAEKQGFSKFGTYTGNGNADGAFVYTGFRPAMIITKRTDGTDHWTLWDNKRESNPNNNVLYPSLSDAESTSDSSYPADLLSNGVKWRGTSTGMNASGANYVFIAFAEAPFVNSNGVPCNAR